MWLSDDMIDSLLMWYWREEKKVRIGVSFSIHVCVCVCATFLFYSCLLDPLRLGIFLNLQRLIYNNHWLNSKNSKRFLHIQNTIATDPTPHPQIWTNSCWDSERFIAYEEGRDMRSFRPIRLQMTMWDKGLAMILIPLQPVLEKYITHCCCASSYMWPCLYAQVQTTNILARVRYLVSACR